MTRRRQWLILVAVWLVLGVVGLAVGLNLGKRRALQPARPQPTASAAQTTLDPEDLAATLAAQTVQAWMTQTAQTGPTATPVAVPAVPGAGGPGQSVPWLVIVALAALGALLLLARRMQD